MLSVFPFLKNLTKESQLQLERRMHRITVTGKDPLIQKGDKVSGVYLVESGALRVYTISIKGKESTLYWIEPGESCILSMNCAFTDVLYPAWVENDRLQTRISIIPSDLFKNLYETDQGVRQFTVNVLSARIFDLMSALEEVSTMPLNSRLANLLIKKSNASLHVVMSHEAMASHLGTAREVVSRNLKNMEQSGFIKVERGYTSILSVEGLRSILLAP